MQHAHPRRSTSRRLVLPALLVTATAGAFGGLAVVPTGAADDRLVSAGAAAPTAGTPPLRERDLERASRSRPRVVPTPSPTPSPKAAAKPVAKPAAKPTAKAAAKPGANALARKALARKALARKALARKARTAAASRLRRQQAVAAPTTRTTTRRTARAAAAPVSSGGRCPVPSASFTDTYGAPRSGGRAHKGTDLLASYGAPVYAVAAGVIDTTSSSNGGISLYLRATNGERYFYAHNSTNVAGDGQRVQAGQLIARVGSTGNAGDINHVHFEREVGGASVNPYRFLRGIC